jgi:prepilin-type processing-associated H-X9-DG protein
MNATSTCGTIPRTRRFKLPPFDPPYTGGYCVLILWADGHVGIIHKGQSLKVVKESAEFLNRMERREAKGYVACAAPLDLATAVVASKGGGAR